MGYDRLSLFSSQKKSHYTGRNVIAYDVDVEYLRVAVIKVKASACEFAAYPIEKNMAMFASAMFNEY